MDSDDSKKRRMLGRLDKLSVKDITDDEITNMVKGWRKQKAKASKASRRTV